jgi:hypothetical protein
VLTSLFFFILFSFRCVMLRCHWLLGALISAAERSAPSVHLGRPQVMKSDPFNGF